MSTSRHKQKPPMFDGFRGASTDTLPGMRTIRECSKMRVVRHKTKILVKGYGAKQMLKSLIPLLEAVKHKSSKSCRTSCFKNGLTERGEWSRVLIMMCELSY